MKRGIPKVTLGGLYPGARYRQMFCSLQHQNFFGTWNQIAFSSEMDEIHAGTLQFENM